MVSESRISRFQRPSGLRDGVHPKPLEVRTRTLSGANPSIKLSAAESYRITQTSTATGSCVMQRGAYDGQVIRLLSVSNSGDAILPSSTLSQTDFSHGDWSMGEGTSIEIQWDARALVWREISRSDVVANNVVIVDDDGNVITASVSNGNNELSVTDADAEESLSALLKEQKRTNELLEKLLKKGKTT